MDEDREEFKELGERLLEARQAAGLTQREVAEELEIAQGTIWRLEHNEYHEMSRDILIAVEEWIEDQ